LNTSLPEEALPPSSPNLARTIVQSKLFQTFIVALIVVAAILVGMETYPSLVKRFGHGIHAVNQVILWIFVAEAALKMAQHGRHFYRYFQDPWNVFDFMIVVVCFLPVNASYAAVLRLARIMRTLRLMTALPQLQLLVAALIKSIPSMGYVGLLLMLNFYVYAVMGVFLFRGNDPVHFRDLPTSMLTLFRVVTLEDWTDVMYLQMYGSNVYAYDNTTGIETVPHAMPIVGCLFFVSFVMFGTMIMLNLFIGVILNSMDEARAERDLDQQEQREKETGERAPTTNEEIDEVMRQLDAVTDRLKLLQRRVMRGE